MIIWLVFILVAFLISRIIRLKRELIEVGNELNNVCEKIDVMSAVCEKQRARIEHLEQQLYGR